MAVTNVYKTVTDVYLSLDPSAAFDLLDKEKLKRRMTHYFTNPIETR